MTIQLKQVIDLLAEGELSNIKYVNIDTGALVLERVPSLIRAINLGVLDLHKRFLLKEGMLKIQLEEGRRLYPLRPAYQVGQKPKPGVTQFITEGNKLGRQSILKIEKIIGDNGVEYFLNDTWQPLNITTPEFDVLEISDEFYCHSSSKTLEVRYRRAPTPMKICVDNLDSWGCIDIDLPYTHLQALLYFVASRCQTPIGFMENTAQEGFNFSQKYEAECANLDAQNLRIDPVGNQDRFVRGGWV